MENVMNLIKTNRYFPWGVAFVAGAIFGFYGNSFTSNDTTLETVAVVEEASANTAHAQVEELLKSEMADENSETPAEAPAVE